MAAQRDADELKRLAASPPELFKQLAEKLGGMAKLAEYLGCTRATAYRLAEGRKRYNPRYLQKALELSGSRPVVNVEARARANFEMPGRDWRFIKPQALVLDCDGAFLVQGNELWPLVADGQYVLYRDVKPYELLPGDLVLASLVSGEILIKAWYPSPANADEVFLATLYRGPKDFRKDLFRPFRMSELKDLKKIVGVWMG